MTALAPRVLIAGIGNIFCSDDGFGCAVAQELARQNLPENIRAVDFGIRGFDLACALTSDCDTAILIDAINRGSPPGTLHVLQLDAHQLASEGPSTGHSLTPAEAIRLAQQLGGPLPRLYLVGCQPAAVDTEKIGLSAAVQAAVEPDVTLVLSLAAGKTLC
jgi:hydrogenase maturation protease